MIQYNWQGCTFLLKSFVMVSTRLAPARAAGEVGESSVRGVIVASFANAGEYSGNWCVFVFLAQLYHVRNGTLISTHLPAGPLFPLNFVVQLRA